MSDAAKARSAGDKADFLKQAKEKFPQWDENANFFLKELKARNAVKPIIKGLDHFLIRYLSEMQEAAKGKSPKKKKAEGGGAVASDKPPAKDPEKPASEKSKPPDDDPLLEDVGSALLARSSADDEGPKEHGSKTLAEICEEIRKDGGPGIHEGDILMEKPGEKSDEEENVEAVKAAEQRQRQLRKRELPPTKSKVTVDTESDDENKALFPKKAKPASKPAIKKAASKPKSERKEQAAQPKSDKDKDADDDSDDDAKKSRYKRKSESQIIAEYNMSRLRPAVQQALFARDGLEIKDGAANRLLNMHTIIGAAELVFGKQEFKNFKSAMLASYEDKADQ